MRKSSTLHHLEWSCPSCTFIWSLAVFVLLTSCDFMSIKLCFTFCWALQEIKVREGYNINFDNCFLGLQEQPRVHCGSGSSSCYSQWFLEDDLGTKSERYRHGNQLHRGRTGECPGRFGMGLSDFKGWANFKKNNELFWIICSCSLCVACIWSVFKDSSVPQKSDTDLWLKFFSFCLHFLD